MKIFIVFVIVLIEDYILYILNKKYDWYHEINLILMSSKKPGNCTKCCEDDMETFGAFVLVINILEFITLFFGNVRINITYVDLCDKDLLLSIVYSVFGNKDIQLVIIIFQIDIIMGKFIIKHYLR